MNLRRFRVPELRQVLFDEKTFWVEFLLLEPGVKYPIRRTTDHIVKNVLPITIVLKKVIVSQLLREKLFENLPIDYEYFHCERGEDHSQATVHVPFLEKLRHRCVYYRKPRLSDN